MSAAVCRSQPIDAVIPHDVPQLVFNTRYYGERAPGGGGAADVPAPARVADFQEQQQVWQIS